MYESSQSKIESKPCRNYTIKPASIDLKDRLQERLEIGEFVVPWVKQPDMWLLPSWEDKDLDKKENLMTLLPEWVRNTCAFDFIQ